MGVAVMTFDLVRHELTLMEDGREVVVPVDQLASSGYWEALSMDCQYKLAAYFQNQSNSHHSIEKNIPRHSDN